MRGSVETFLACAGGAVDADVPRAAAHAPVDVQALRQFLAPDRISAPGVAQTPRSARKRQGLSRRAANYRHACWSPDRAIPPKARTPSVQRQSADFLRALPA